MIVGDHVTAIVPDEAGAASPRHVEGVARPRIHHPRLRGDVDDRKSSGVEQSIVVCSCRGSAPRADTWRGIGCAAAPRCHIPSNAQVRSMPTSPTAAVHPSTRMIERAICTPLGEQSTAGRSGAGIPLPSLADRLQGRRGARQIERAAAFGERLHDGGTVLWRDAGRRRISPGAVVAFKLQKAFAPAVQDMGWRRRAKPRCSEARSRRRRFSWRRSP